MTKLEDKTVAEIVTEDIATAAVFKKNGIDFCCGGKVQLNEICSKKNIDTKVVVEQLKGILSGSADENAENPGTWSLTKLIDHIVTKHHAYVRESLPVILEFANKVAKVHGHGAPEVIEVAQLVNDLEEELMTHMMKEEMRLFPYVKQLEYAKGRSPLPTAPFGSVSNPINMMQVKHDAAGETLARLNEITNGYQPPEWACNTYRALYHMLQEFEEDLHLHIHSENNILFPKAIELERSLA